MRSGINRERIVGIDARMIHHSGIGVYLRSLLKAFEQSQLLSEGSEKIVLFGKPGSLSTFNGHFEVHSFEAPIYSVSEQFGYWGLSSRVDLLHCPHYNTPFLSRGRWVVTVHDIIPWIFRGRYYSRAEAAYLRASVGFIARRAERIIAVSQSTKRDLAEFFHLPDKKITVIHEAAGDKFRPASDEKALEEFLERSRLREGYFLYVGALRPHKNCLRLIKIFRGLRAKKGWREKLVLIGKKAKKMPRGFEELESFQSEEGIQWVEEVPENDLNLYYQGARALVFPSLYEGFGLPLLEAMAAGCPVLTSNRSALPEVAGEAAYFIDPDSDSELALGIERLRESEELRSRLRERGLARVKAFSWEKAARETLEVYREVLQA